MPTIMEKIEVQNCTTMKPLNNMKQTAIQELIDWAVSLQYNQQQCTDWIVIKNKAESLLEMEKQQIIDAANLPIKDRWYVATKYSNCGEQYYSKTYVKSNI